jgi:hypothetical protein
LHNERAEADIAIRPAGGTVQDAKHVILKAVKEVVGQVEGERGVKGHNSASRLTPPIDLDEDIGWVGRERGRDLRRRRPYPADHGRRQTLPVRSGAISASCTGTTKDLTVGEPEEEHRGLSEIASSGFSDGRIAHSYRGLLGC